jgi:trans-aconitate 2-methyltransferase
VQQPNNQSSEKKAAMAWNPTQYLKFGAHRLRPAIDLLNGATAALSSPIKVEQILDMGCGPGNMAELLCRAFPVANVEGIDSSFEMVQKAIIDNSVSLYGGRVSFRMGTIEDEVVRNKQKKYDIVYSNASLHWCQNHETLFPGLVKKLLKPDDSVFAVQMPDTINQPTHTLMREAAINCKLQHIVDQVRIPRMDHSMDFYFKLMSPLCKSVDMWTTDCMQQLEVDPGYHRGEAPHPVIEFVQATGLRPILDAIKEHASEEAYVAYLNEYQRLIGEFYRVSHICPPEVPEGRHIALVPYKRFFMICGQ